MTDQEVRRKGAYRAAGWATLIGALMLAAALGIGLGVRSAANDRFEQRCAAAGGHVARFDSYRSATQMCLSSDGRVLFT